MAKYTLYVNFKLIRRKFDVEVYVIIIENNASCIHLFLSFKFNKF